MFSICPHITITLNPDITDRVLAKIEAVERLPDTSLIHLIKCVAIGKDLRMAMMTSLAERWDETGQDTDGERKRIDQLLRNGDI